MAAPGYYLEKVYRPQHREQRVLSELSNWNWKTGEAKVARTCRAETRQERAAQRENSRVLQRAILSVQVSTAEHMQMRKQSEEWERTMQKTQREQTPKITSGQNQCLLFILRMEKPHISHDKSTRNCPASVGNTKQTLTKWSTGSA